MILYSQPGSEMKKLLSPMNIQNFKWVNLEEAKTLLAWEGQRKSVDIIKRILHQSNVLPKIH